MRRTIEGALLFFFFLLAGFAIVAFTISHLIVVGTIELAGAVACAAWLSMLDAHSGDV